MNLPLQARQLWQRSRRICQQRIEVGTGGRGSRFVLGLLGLLVGTLCAHRLQSRTVLILGIECAGERRGKRSTRRRRAGAQRSFETRALGWPRGSPFDLETKRVELYIPLSRYMMGIVRNLPSYES